MDTDDLVIETLIEIPVGSRNKDRPGGKETEVCGWSGRAEAVRIITACRDAFQQAHKD